MRERATTPQTAAANPVHITADRSSPSSASAAAIRVRMAEASHNDFGEARLGFGFTMISRRVSRWVTWSFTSSADW